MKKAPALGFVLASLVAGSTLASEVENIRTIVPKAEADKVCPVGSTASYVTAAYRGATGSYICAADHRGWKPCVGVKSIYVTAANNYGRYEPHDLGCSQPVNHPWPWGEVQSAPGTLSAEWNHGSTHVVCCYG